MHKSSKKHSHKCQMTIGLIFFFFFFSFSFSSDWKPFLFFLWFQMEKNIKNRAFNFILIIVLVVCVCVCKEFVGNKGEIHWFDFYSLKKDLIMDFILMSCRQFSNSWQSFGPLIADLKQNMACIASEPS